MNVIRMLDAIYSLLIEVNDEIRERDARGEKLPISSRNVQGLRFAERAMCRIFSDRWPDDEIPF